MPRASASLLFLSYSDIKSQRSFLGHTQSVDPRRRLQLKTTSGSSCAALSFATYRVCDSRHFLRNNGHDMLRAYRFHIDAKYRVRYRSKCDTNSYRLPFRCEDAKRHKCTNKTRGLSWRAPDIFKLLTAPKTNHLVGV